MEWCDEPIPEQAETAVEENSTEEELGKVIGEGEGNEEDDEVEGDDEEAQESIAALIEGHSG